MAKEKVGLLVMAYGTPYKPEDIEPYYTHIRHGHRPSDEALEDLKSRYQAIGGISPLAKITEDQASALAARLNEVQTEYEFELFLGLKHIQPFIEDAVKAMGEKQIKKAVSLVLAPHYSTFSVKAYNARAEREAEKYGIHMHTVQDWYEAPGFIDYWRKQIMQTFTTIDQAEWDETMVIFSAHSLPEKILQNNDPYPEQLQKTTELIVDAAGIENFAIGWQSEGNTGDPWLGPDVQDLTRELFEAKPYKHFIYAPVGFVSDHLEVLYDNDYECKVVCDELGANYHRPDMPNTDPLFINTLSEVILKKAVNL